MRIGVSILSMLCLVGLENELFAQPARTIPALVPQLADGPLATREDELNAAFMPDGKTVYFTRRLGERFGVIMVSRFRDGRWSTPTVAPFSGQHADYDPAVSPDGNRIFWISLRPVDGVPKTDYDIWMADRVGDGWGPAIHLDAQINTSANEYFPSVARNGTLYFSSGRPGGKGRGDIYFSRLVGGRYDPPESIGDSINSPAFEGDAFIAPDESYLVFTGWGRSDGDAEGDLFVSVIRAGTWSAPRRLDNGINSSAKDYAPSVSPDGRWFYFASYRSVIDEPLRRPLTSSEVRQMADGPLNGRGNVYRVPIEAVLSRNR